MCSWMCESGSQEPPEYKYAKPWYRVRLLRKCGDGEKGRARVLTTPQCAETRGRKVARESEVEENVN